MLIEKRNYWRNVPQMTVLLGGMRCVKHQLWSFKSWCSASRVLTMISSLIFLIWQRHGSRWIWYYFEGHNRTTESWKALVHSRRFDIHRIQSLLLQKCMDVLIHQKSL
jgi:hypothetical protein